jgi:predicted SAM-dependent methyltransferase
MDELDCINLGCGPSKKHRYLNVDLEGTYKPEIVLDLNGDWPFEKNFYREVFAENILEHIYDAPRFINAVHDILRPGGLFDVSIPYWSGQWATGDPTHIHFFNEDSFNGWTVWADRYFHLNQGRRFSEKGRFFRIEGKEVDRIELVRRGFGEVLGIRFQLIKI